MRRSTAEHMISLHVADNHVAAAAAARIWSWMTHCDESSPTCFSKSVSVTYRCRFLINISWLERMKDQDFQLKRSFVTSKGYPGRHDQIEEKRFPFSIIEALLH